MTVTLDQIFAIFPVLIMGITVIVIILSIIFHRNSIKHILLAIVGLSIALIIECSLLYKNFGIHSVHHLIYIDKLSIFYAILIIFSSLASIVLIYTQLLHQPVNYYDEFPVLLLISSMGGILLTVSNHFSILFLGMELMTIPMFGLMNYFVFHKTSMEVGIKYIVLSVISSSFLLFGIVFIYAATGYLSFFNIKEVLLAHNNINMVISDQFIVFIIIGLGMLLVGFGFKLSFVPFHLWIPEIYHRVSPAVLVYLATAAKTAVILVLVRIFLILPEQYSKIFYVFLSGAACCSMLFGSILAIQQNNIKRVLAYSSITHSGYLLAILITSHVNTYCVFQEAIGIYLISYIFSNIGVFSVINIISMLNFEKDSDMLCVYRGLFWRDPILSIIFTIMMLSLAGIPITLGFISKFYLLLVSISNKLWCITVFIIVSSIISIFYYLKIIINLYIRSENTLSLVNSNKCISVWKNNPSGVMSIIISLVILALGLYPQPLIQLMIKLA